MNKWIIEDMCNKLDYLVGHKLYIGELDYYIYQPSLANGTILYSKSKTIQWIVNYFDDIAGVIKECYLDDSINFKKVFISPESFHVDLVFFLAREYIRLSDWVLEHEYDEIELTDDIIETIKKELLDAI